MIAAVLFDLDETLLDRTGSLAEFLADQHARFGHCLGHVPFILFRDRFLALDARGRTPKSIVYSALLVEFGCSLELADTLLADYRDRCCHYAKAFPHVATVLTSLRTYGLKLGIVTNGETEFQTRHINALHLDPLVDAILISESEGIRKPDCSLFLRAAARLNVNPASCLFVGDSPEADIFGAHVAGMQTAWFANGITWPSDLPAMPGIAIEQLSDLIAVCMN